MKEMVKHLVNLLFVNAIVVFLLRRRTKSGAEYNIKLIGQPTHYFEFSAAVIGIASWVIAVLIVISFDQNIMIVIAAVFISFGTGRQIFASALDVVTTNLNSFLSSWASTILLLAKSRLMVTTTTTTDWNNIESKVDLIVVSTRKYNLPVKLDGVKPESQQILLEYLDEHKWELEYRQAITYDDSSCLAFAQYATKQMIAKLLIYNQLEELQESSGGVGAIVFIALGTLIWLIS
ncbi:hypothetical protein [Candidatus Nitrosocosmicus sp. R]